MTASSLRADVVKFLQDHPPVKDSSLLSLEMVHGHNVFQYQRDWIDQTYRQHHVPSLARHENEDAVLATSLAEKFEKDRIAAATDTQFVILGTGTSLAEGTWRGYCKQCRQTKLGVG